MAIAQTLNVVVQAQTQKFNRGMGQAQNSLALFAKSMRALLTPMGAIAGVFLAGRSALRSFNSAIEITIRNVSEAAKRIDDLGKKADKLGILTGELQTMRLAAAEFSGMASSTLDMALQRMVVRIAEAGAGFGEARGALEELGLNASELSLLGPYQQFQMLMEAMKGVENQSDRLRLVRKMFDSEGVGLVSTLNATADELKEIERFLDAVGASLNDIEVDQMEALNDSINRLSIASEGLWNQFALGFSTGMQQVVDDISKNLEGIEALALTVRSLGIVLGALFATLASVVEDAIEKIQSGDFIGFLTTGLQASEWQNVRDEFIENYNAGILDLLEAQSFTPDAAPAPELEEELVKPERDYMRNQRSAAEEFAKGAEQFERTTKDFRATTDVIAGQGGGRGPEQAAFFDQSIAAAEEGSMAAVQAILAAQRTENNPEIQLQRDQLRTQEDIERNTKAMAGVVL